MQAHFIIGPTGVGKTTFARKLVLEAPALVYSIDDWMQVLFAADLAGANDFAAIAARTARVREQMWRVAEQAVTQGLCAILDTGLLTRADRERQWRAALDRGFAPRFHFIYAAPEERWRRIEARNAYKGATHAFPITRPMFDFIERLFEAPGAEERAALPYV